MRLFRRLGMPVSAGVFVRFQHHDLLAVEKHIITLMGAYPTLGAIAILGQDFSGSTTFDVLTNQDVNDVMRLPSDAFMEGEFRE